MADRGDKGSVGGGGAKRLIGTAVALAALSVASVGGAMDRADFAKVLNLIPPNGPFWKYGNVTMRMRSREAGMPPVVFAHWSHRARYTCRVCHQELGFSMRMGDSGITRKELVAGKFCGGCHNGRTAFSVKVDGNCKKCHMGDTAELENLFDEFSRSLPLAPFGNGIDWAKALASGDVAPANSLTGSTRPLQFPEKLRKPLKLGTTADRSDVRFSHQDHFAELDCSSCHPDIFNIKLKSTAAFSMESNIYGSFCGACHMLVAFPMNDCNRCHKMMSNGTAW
jgi:c(7)-type cytochrome triheme protein